MWISTYSTRIASEIASTKILSLKSTSSIETLIKHPPLLLCFGCESRLRLEPNNHAPTQALQGHMHCTINATHSNFNNWMFINSHTQTVGLKPIYYLKWVLYQTIELNVLSKRTEKMHRGYNSFHGKTF